MDDGQQQRVFRAPLPADSAGAGPSVPAQALAVPPSTSRTITDTIIGGEYRGEKEEKGGRRRKKKNFFSSSSFLVSAIALPWRAVETRNGYSQTSLRGSLRAYRGIEGVHEAMLVIGTREKEREGREGERAREQQKEKRHRREERRRRGRERRIKNSFPLFSRSNTNQKTEHEHTIVGYSLVKGIGDGECN